MFINSLAVFIGGGSGALARYFTGLIMLKYASYNLPFSTFVVNIAGSLILGFLYILFINRPEFSPGIKLALTAGFCGGLTTFSTMSLEVFEMLGNQRFIHAFLYILISILIGLLAVSFGAFLCKVILNSIN